MSMELYSLLSPLTATTWSSSQHRGLPSVGHTCCDTWPSHKCLHLVLCLGKVSYPNLKRFLTLNLKRLRTSPFLVQGCASHDIPDGHTPKGNRYGRELLGCLHLCLSKMKPIFVSFHAQVFCSAPRWLGWNLMCIYCGPDSRRGLYLHGLPQGSSQLSWGPLHLQVRKPRLKNM